MAAIAHTNMATKSAMLFIGLIRWYDEISTVTCRMSIVDGT